MCEAGTWRFWSNPRRILSIPCHHRYLNSANTPSVWINCDNTFRLSSKHSWNIDGERDQMRYACSIGLLECLSWTPGLPFKYAQPLRVLPALSVEEYSTTLERELLSIELQRQRRAC